jgi:hypothetical protein
MKILGEKKGTGTFCSGHLSDPAGRHKKGAGPVITQT